MLVHVLEQHDKFLLRIDDHFLTLTCTEKTQCEEVDEAERPAPEVEVVRPGEAEWDAEDVRFYKRLLLQHAHDQGFRFGNGNTRGFDTSCQMTQRM